MNISLRAVGRARHKLYAVFDCVRAVYIESVWEIWKARWFTSGMRDSFRCRTNTFENDVYIRLTLFSAHTHTKSWSGCGHWKCGSRVAPSEKCAACVRKRSARLLHLYIENKPRRIYNKMRRRRSANPFSAADLPDCKLMTPPDKVAAHALTWGRFAPTAAEINFATPPRENNFVEIDLHTPDMLQRDGTTGLLPYWTDFSETPKAMANISQGRVKFRFYGFML